MKKKCFIIIFCLCIKKINSQVIIDTIRITTEKVDTNYFKKSGVYPLNLNVQNGKWRTYYENGQLYAEYIIINNKLNGTIVYYWPNGNVFIIAKNSNGLLDGVLHSFHSNGEIASINFWDNGKGIGTWRFYTFKGKLYKKVKSTDPSLGL